LLEKEGIEIDFSKNKPVVKDYQNKLSEFT